MIKRGKAEKWAARGERLSAALRENLKRRKEQARERDRERDSARNHAPDVESLANDAKMQTPAPDFRRNPGRD
jgi:hypothetical protein